MLPTGNKNSTANELCIVGSIFYFGYLAAEFPLVACLSKYPVGKFLAILAMGWGLMTLLMSACHNASGLFALRFFMGMMEAPALPGLTVLTSMWYTKKEQALRVAIWSSTVASVSLSLTSTCFT
jgi:MFS transporter, ACS family, allantoate permease